MGKREERAVAIPWADGSRALDGIFIAGLEADSVGIVVAAPHPLYGGSMDSPVVNEIAYAARGAGLASLRFDWRGIGASAGEASGDPNDAVADYEAALDHLCETVPGAIIAAGYSFGAAAAVRAAAGRPQVRRLLLVAPPPSMLDAEALADFPGSVFVIAAAEDSLAPPDALEVVVAGLPRAKLGIIPGADHFFGTGLADIGRHTTEWLAGG
jgi:alpha/beta superfamily hydrolase